MNKNCLATQLPCLIKREIQVSIYFQITWTVQSFQVSPVLKHKQQRGVTCLAWRPFLASELAVGCLSAILIWTVDPLSVVARPSANCVYILPTPQGINIFSDKVVSLYWTCQVSKWVKIIWVSNGPEFKCHLSTQLNIVQYSDYRMNI